MTSETRTPDHLLRLGAVVIGGSAGSVDGLLTMVERLPADFAMPIALVVHTPKELPNTLVNALGPRSKLPVREPFDKEPFVPGTLFVAAPGYHLLIERGPSFGFSVDEPVNYSRPSIDVLFESALDTFGARLVAVILSGANQDGARGLAALGRAGGVAFVQAPEKASAPEMPRAALEACPSAVALSLPDLLRRLMDVAAARIGRNT
jgi:two-component system, chemotaxis family, protein-glutamate methylesterase/glutaminase